MPSRALAEGEGALASYWLAMAAPWRALAEEGDRSRAAPSRALAPHWLALIIIIIIIVVMCALF